MERTTRMTMTRTPSPTRIPRLVSFVLFFYYLPITAIWAGLIPFRFRFHVLVIMTAVVALYAALVKRTPRQLGLRIDTLRDSVILNSLLSAVLAVGLIVAYRLGAIRQPTIPTWTWFFTFYVFVSSPCQEFLFRGAIFAEMEARGVRSLPWQIAISTITYAYLHVIYSDVITLTVTVVMGLVWGLIYAKKPNLLAVSLSHAVLGVISVLVGLI